ncbi:MAG: ankyrin repeat domain-containing protein [Ehrlichia sp.]
MSFIDLIAPLSAEEILSLTYEGGTVLYYLMMSLHIVCGVDDVDSNNAMKRQVEKLLLEAVSTSESILQSGDQKKFLQFATQDKVSELGEIRDKLKMLYASVAGKVSRTLLDAMSSDEDVTEPDQEILRQEKIESKVRIFNSAINVIKIISNTINSSVARGEVSIQQVSNFLSYCDVSAESHIPDTMSFLNRLYFLITDRDLSDCMRELVSTFLVSFSQYTLDTCGRNAIHYAVNMCCYEEQERFLSETIQPIVCSRPLVARTLDKSGNNLIHYAVSSPYVNFKIIKYLCENFPDMVMTKNVHGDTPLHIMANTYFVYFARVSVFFDFTCGRSLKKIARLCFY